MVIKAQSPAGFAEEYIIESIWNNRFPPGSISLNASFLS